MRNLILFVVTFAVLVKSGYTGEYCVVCEDDSCDGADAIDCSILITTIAPTTNSDFGSDTTIITGATGKTDVPSTLGTADSSATNPGTTDPPTTESAENSTSDPTEEKKPRRFRRGILSLRDSSYTFSCVSVDYNVTDEEPHKLKLCVNADEVDAFCQLYEDTYGENVSCVGEEPGSAANTLKISAGIIIVLLLNMVF